MAAASLRFFGPCVLIYASALLVCAHAASKPPATAELLPAEPSDVRTFELKSSGNLIDHQQNAHMRRESEYGNRPSHTASSQSSSDIDPVRMASIKEPKIAKEVAKKQLALNPPLPADTDPVKSASEEAVKSVTNASKGAANKTLPVDNNSAQKPLPNYVDAKGAKGNTTAALDTPAEERVRYKTLALVVFPIAVVLAILFETYHFRWSEVNWNLQLDRADGLEGSEHVDNSFRGLTSNLCNRACSLGRIYFCGGGKIKGRVYVLMLFGHNLFGQYLNLVNFDFMRRFWNLYEEPSMALFSALIMNWAILYTCMSITGVYSSYTQGMLTIHWRDHMTRYFNAIWLPNSYAMRVQDDRRFDNPDQRIQEDISSFVGDSYGMTLGLWNSVTSLCIYGYMLFTISPTSFFGYCNIPGWLFYVALAYSAFGSGVMHILGADLAHYSWLGERYSGNFRGELRRVYDQSETVAAIGSQDAELNRLQNRFEDVKHITWRSMLLNKRLSWFNHVYGPFSSILFMVILMPFFIRGEVDLGRIKQCEMALGQVSSSLNYFVSNYGQLSSYRAVVDRLHNFRQSAITYMNEKGPSQDGGMPIDEKMLQTLAVKGMPVEWPVALGGKIKKEGMEPEAILALSNPALLLPAGSVHKPAPSLDLIGATVKLPNGEDLLEKVTLRIPQGTCALIAGKEGSGKSTLLRALAGIWPYMSATGQAGAGDTVFINQKPRLPSPMTLRELVTFPQEVGTYGDSEILKALGQVDLSMMAASGLDVSLDANSVLSGGEFQRLMVAHCLLAKPRYILLDEAMAHLSRANQFKMYSLLRHELVETCGCALVTTSHDWRSLAHFHDAHYIIRSGASGSTRDTGLVEAFDPATEAAESVAPSHTDSVESLRLTMAEKDAEIARLQQELADTRMAKAAEKKANAEDDDSSEYEEMRF